jgi:hypothetical protein
VSVERAAGAPVRVSRILGRVPVCEYCGCQQIAAIDELTREHDAVVAATALIRSRLEMTALR